MSAQSNKPVFYAIALILPLLILALFEGVLRLSGYGKEVPLFVKSESMPGYLQPNPELILRYFSHPSLAPKVSPDTVYFPEVKADGVFRIVIQGGSSAAGFPYGRFGSLQGMIEQRFKRLFPDKQIEVINTAMAAVNTYTLLDIADEILDIEPDLVLVYTGHNEYLGVLGAGSTLSPKGGRFATLAYLKLKELKLYQLLEQAFVASQLPADTDVDQNSRTLMSKVAKGKQIPLDSDLYHAGIEQFQGNLSALIDIYRNAGIPVVVGDLVSNEKDLPPFSTVGKVDWKSTDAKISNALIASSAEANAYAKGWQELNKGQTDAAVVAFKQARDLDQLRFRAPSQFNQIIHQMSQLDGVYLASVDQTVRADTTDGLIGDKHMLEHVHPTKRGYFLLAEAFVDAIVQNQFVDSTSTAYPLELAWLETPLSELDDRWAALKVAQLTRAYPFSLEEQPAPRLSQNDQIDVFLLERVQGKDWLSLQNALLAYYETSNQLSQAAKVAGIISDALVHSHQASNNAAKLYRRLEDFPMAIYYQQRAIRLAPDSAQYLLNQAHNKFLVNELAESLTLLEKASELATGKQKQRAQFFINKVKKQLEKQAS